MIDPSPQRSEAIGRWGLVVLVGVALGIVTLTIAAANFDAFFVGAVRPPQSIVPGIMDAIERDPGFDLLPPGAVVERSARRLDCVDESGDSPETWREVRVTQTPDEIVGFYTARLPDYGWTLASAPGSNQNATRPPDLIGFTHTKGMGRKVKLLTWVGLTDHTVTVTARVVCDP